MDIEGAIFITGVFVIIPVILIGIVFAAYVALVLVLLVLSVVIATFTYIHDFVKYKISYKPKSKQIKQ